MVFFFKFIDGEGKDTGEEKKIPLLKYYSVFHVRRYEGMKPRFAESCHGGLIPDKRAEQILQDYIDYSGVKLKKQQKQRQFKLQKQSTKQWSRQRTAGQLKSL